MTRRIFLVVVLASCATEPATSITTPPPSGCMLAVIQGSRGQQSAPQTPGFLTIPGGQFVAATDAANGMSYDRDMKKWLPVTLRSQTPDGHRYVYADHNRTESTFHVVDLTTNRDTVIGPARPWVGAGLDNVALYAMRVEFMDTLAYGTIEISRGLWKIPLDGSSPVQLTADSRRWEWAAAGGIYGDISTGDVAGAPNDIARLDVSTGKTQIWFTPRTRARVIAVDGSGAAFVLTDAADEELWRVTEPGREAKIWSGPSDAIRPDGVVAIDGSTVWFSSSSPAPEWAIFQFTPGTGLREVASFTDRPYSVAGPCV